MVFTSKSVHPFVHGSNKCVKADHSGGNGDLKRCLFQTNVAANVYLAPRLGCGPVNFNSVFFLFFIVLVYFFLLRKSELETHLPTGNKHIAHIAQHSASISWNSAGIAGSLKHFACRSVGEDGCISTAKMCETNKFQPMDCFNATVRFQRAICCTSIHGLVCTKAVR